MTDRERTLSEAADICRDLYNTHFASASPNELLLLTKAEERIRSHSTQEENDGAA